ncbi:DUF2889 domain-containing protein [Marinobacterium lutimaris]|uniref:DUF2889 domain-containing protein n=1 Tax=Marinobacterium lutimaris TaxID=568106 RepID=A0A1H5VT59_9GAMM|nr:DUF2889 domain-containing protein [Marinobacterium lutimaris]SEF90472.1 Protein of unknown function [Marinobacterium lutimaris]
MSESGKRKLLHTRQVVCRGYELDNGLWEIEGRMSDVKSFPMENRDRGGLIDVGEPLHDIGLTLTIDRTLKIHHAKAVIDAAPFNQCSGITGAFKRLEGLRLESGFTRKVREILGGVKGCTHLIELLGPISTTAYQTLWQTENGYNGNDPSILHGLADSCHTLARDGDVMAPLLPEGDSLTTDNNKREFGA